MALRTWTIEIGGIARNYKNLKIERRLKRTKPLKFSALIEYATDLNYFDVVELKRNGTSEWKGFLEEMEIEWDKGGRYLHVSGRDTSLIAWKKYGEGFSNMHKDTKGFFGSVNANELIKLLLRTPKSDAYDEETYPNNKEGWGLDTQNRIGALAACRTGSGDPNYCKLRRRGYGWRNSGNPFASAQQVVDGEISRSDWNPNGAPPYLDDDDAVNYIDSNTVDGTAIYSFGNIPVGGGTPTSVERVTVTVVWKPEATWWWWLACECWIYISPDGGTTWYHAGMFWGKGPMLAPNPYRHFSYDVSKILNTVAKVNNARIKLVNKSSQLKTFVTQAYLMVGYTAGGDQAAYDWFSIPISREEICGVYIESRMDDDSYPRHYDIVTASEEKQPLLTDGWTEEDPNSHIGVPSEYHVDFEAHNDEDAYLWKDYGADYFGIYFRLAGKIKVVTDPVPAPDRVTGGFWCVSQAKDDLRALEVAKTPHISLSVERTGGVPKFRMWVADGAASFGGVGSCPELTEGTTYTFDVERINNKVYIKIYNPDNTLFYEFGPSIIGSSNFYQYAMTAITWNDGNNNDPVNMDIDDIAFEVYTTLASEVTNNTYRDIIHSWEPTTIDNIRIRITDATADKTWAISQVYVYKAEREEFRVFRDSFTNSLLTVDAATGQKDCTVADGSLFEVGDIVYISDDNAGETNRVASISVNTLTMENNLVNAYSVSASGKVQVGFNPLQYIAATSFDSSYSTPIGPLNIPRGRVIDQIESVLRLCEASYIPYEWWLAYDGSNTFHVKNQRGDDVSGAVSFVKGTNLGGTTKISGIADTTQRVKIMGQGEGKKQETASSEWINSFDDMVTNNTFFEDIISEKSIPDVETATVVGNIIVTEEGPVKNQITLNINNDDHASMAYDVGDIVTVTDALTAIDSTFKIYNIVKRIDSDGEKITMVVDSPLKDEGDEWHEVYRRLKMLEISEAAIADWTGEANKEGQISSEKAITSFFEKTAKNDEDSQKRGQTDPNWFMDPDPTAFQAGSAQVGAVRARPSYYSYANNMRWIHSNDWMKFMGPDGAVNDQLLVELRGSNDTGGGSDEYDVVDPINVELSRNPKLVVELKLWEPTGGAPTQWKVGDFFDIGLYSHEAGYRKGFFFRIKALGGSAFKIYAVKNEGGTLLTDDVETLIRTIDASDQSNTYKYRLEIIIEADNRYAIFNVYDMDEQQEYPPSVVYIGIDTTMIVRPLCMYMDATGGANLRAIVYIYKFRTEWEKVQ